ncbi:MAG: hypothetical protein IJA83_03225 [Clostridia bacterium]|nr:hypothetical protein [Clostridia bacterium]
MKKMLCLLLAVLLVPVYALAEESAATLTHQELNAWAANYLERAMASEPLNNPAESLTADGYEFVYDFATIYADTPDMSSDTAINAVVLTGDTESGPRSINVGSAMSEVLGAYYSENPDLTGTKENAVLYTVNLLPASAAWGQVLRDGQRVQTIQYGVHEQLATGGEGYTDAGVIYTMLENRVSAVRVYGLNSRVTPEEVNTLMAALASAAQEASYTQVPFSYNGLELTAFSEADLVFSGLNFLTLTPEAAEQLLGKPLSDTWMEDGENGYTRLQVFDGFELTYTYDKAKANCQVYMLLITKDGLEGPRGVRCGDAFSSVYNRFRNGEGEYGDDGVEMLYGQNNVGTFGKASYGDDASARLRYGFELADGRSVVLQMDFTVMELEQIMLFAD